MCVKVQVTTSSDPGVSLPLSRMIIPFQPLPGKHGVMVQDVDDALRKAECWRHLSYPGLKLKTHWMLWRLLRFVAENRMDFSVKAPIFPRNPLTLGQRHLVPWCSTATAPEPCAVCECRPGTELPRLHRARSGWQPDRAPWVSCSVSAASTLPRSPEEGLKELPLALVAGFILSVDA